MKDACHCHKKGIRKCRQARRTYTRISSWPDKVKAIGWLGGACTYINVHMYIYKCTCLQSACTARLDPSNKSRAQTFAQFNELVYSLVSRLASLRSARITRRVTFATPHLSSTGPKRVGMVVEIWLPLLHKWLLHTCTDYFNSLYWTAFFYSHK